LSGKEREGVWVSESQTLTLRIYIYDERDRAEIWDVWATIFGDGPYNVPASENVFTDRLRK
jgi:hypothetical protein